MLILRRASAKASHQELCRQTDTGRCYLSIESVLLGRFAITRVTCISLSTFTWMCVTSVRTCNWCSFWRRNVYYHSTRTFRTDRDSNLVTDKTWRICLWRNSIMIFVWNLDNKRTKAYINQVISSIVYWMYLTFHSVIIIILYHCITKPFFWHLKPIFLSIFLHLSVIVNAQPLPARNNFSLCSFQGLCFLQHCIWFC